MKWNLARAPTSNVGGGGWRLSRGSPYWLPQSALRLAFTAARIDSSEPGLPLSKMPACGRSPLPRPMGSVKPEGVPPLNACLHRCQNRCRLQGRRSHRWRLHEPCCLYFEFGTHFRPLSRADTKFNPTFWALDQSEFKFGVSTLFGCEEKRMQS